MRTYEPLILDGVRFLRDKTSGRLLRPLVGAKGDTTIPPPTAEETALQQKQLDLLTRQETLSKKQQAEMEALAPYLYSQMGLKKVSTPNAKIGALEQELAQLKSQGSAAPSQTFVKNNPRDPGRWVTTPGNPAEQQRQARIAELQQKIARAKANPTTSFAAMSEEEKRAQMSPEEIETADIRSLANQRTKKALEGNLDVDPSVEADIQRGTSQLRAELLRKLGPGAEGSDSWNRAMSEYDRNMNAVRYSVRHGEMTTADALATNRGTEAMRRQDQALRNLKGATDPYAATAATLSGVGQNIGGTMDQLYGRRIDAADLAMTGSGQKNAFWGSIIGAGLGAGGMAAGYKCWIAEALYGRDAPETHLLRYWLNQVWEPRSRIGRLVMRLYGWQGLRVADWVHRSRVVRWLIQPVFDWGLRVAQRELCEGGRHG